MRLRDDRIALRIEPRPPETLLAELRPHRDALAAELRTETELATLVGELIVDRVELESAGALPPVLLAADVIGEKVEARRRALGVAGAMELARRLYAAAVVCDVEALRRIEAQAEPEAAGELRACDRENDDLHRLRTGLGIEVDALLWSVLDRLDSARAERCWRHVQRALADDLLSRLVGWVRSLANANAEQVDVLLVGGPRAHDFHDATPRGDASELRRPGYTLGSI